MTDVDPFTIEEREEIIEGFQRLCSTTMSTM